MEGRIPLYLAGYCEIHVSVHYIKQATTAEKVEDLLARERERERESLTQGIERESHTV